MTKNKNLVIGFLILLSLLYLLIPEIAFAADIFEIRPGDKSKEMFLDKLFDITSAEKLKGSPLSGVIGTFNNCVLMVGGILLSYTLIAGTMSTAHDGEVLGKQWSGKWLPMRTAFGAAMIFPTVGGFCAAQFVVIWLIHQGVGLANTIWDEYVDHMPMSSMASFNGPDRAESFNLALNLLRANYCSLVVNDYYDNLKREHIEKGVDKPADYYPVVDRYKNVDSKVGKTRYNYGIKESDDKVEQAIASYYGSSNVAEKSCGSVTFEYDPSQYSVQSNFSLTSLHNMLQMSKGGLEGVESSKNAAEVVADVIKNQGKNLNLGIAGLGPVNETKIAAYENMDAKMKALAIKYFQSNNKRAMRGEIYQEANEAANSFTDAIKKSGESIFYGQTTTGFDKTTIEQNWSNFAKDMKDEGWMYAGSWYMQLYRVQSLIANISKTLPIYKGEDNLASLMIRDRQSLIQAPIDELNSNLLNISDNFQLTKGKNRVMLEYKKNNGTEDSNMSDDDVSKLFREAKNAISHELSKVTTSVIDYAANNPNYYSSPLALAYTIGDGLETAFWAISIGLFAGSFISSGMLTALITLISPLTSTIFIISNMLTVVLPFMPFFLWLGAVLGWAVLCIEAIIAAPLWLMIHVHPDGDGVVGRGGAGYGMVLSLTVRPALMILGLICSMICIAIFAEIVNDMFVTAFYTIANRNGISILQLPIMVATYAMALFLIIKKAFSLIHVIPDEVLKWLGVQNHNSVQNSAMGGMSTMMAAKMVDDKIGHMSASRAAAEGKNVSDRKKADKEAIQGKRAAEQLKNDESTISEFMNREGSGSEVGKSAQFGEVASTQMSQADSVIGRSNKPFASMSEDELRSVQEAHKVKSENLGEALNNSGINPDGAVGKRMQSQKSASDIAISEIEKHLSKNGNGGKAPSPERPSSED